MGKLRKIVYLTEAQKETLFSEQTLTVNGVTINYNENDIYVTSNNNIPLSDIIATTNDNNKFLKVDTGVPTCSVLSSTDIPTISITDKTSGILPVNRGGTGVTAIADIQAGKDGDGNTISSTYLKLSGGTMTGQIVLASTGFKTNAADGYSLDSHGNFQHLRNATSDYFHFNNSEGTAKLSIYWETGNVTAVGTITAPTFSGSLNGNAATATKFASSQSITLTGDTTGTVSSQAGWSITTKTDRLSTVGDNRTIATIPNDYSHKIIFQGLKSNNHFNSPSTDIYSYVIGLRGWADDSGGKAHEFAFNDSGINHRIGSTTSWENWEKIVTSGNYTGYTVTKTGSGASGTWGISITGNAATATKATQDADGNTISSTYLKLSGGTMTGNLVAKKITIEHTSGEQQEYRVTYGSTVDMSLMIGTGNENHGIYDSKASKWMIYADASGNVTVNGNAATATKATQDGSGNTITSTYAKLSADNNLINHTNEFTFAASGQSGHVWFNYRTAGGTNGNITEYRFGDGKGGSLASITSGNFSGNAATATKATQDGSGNNIGNTYLKMNTAGGIASCEGGGSNWYFRIATVKITSAYINRPIVFEISGRGMELTWVQLIFGSTGNTDPGLQSFTTNNWSHFWVKKTTTSTWEVYGKYNEIWGNATLHRVTGCGANIGVTVNMVNIGTTEPSGATKASYSGNVGYANSAGSVAWGNVTGKPGLFTQRSLNDTNINNTSGNWATSVSDFDSAHGTFPYESSTWMQIIQFDAVHFKVQLGITVDGSGSGSRSLWFRSTWANNNNWSIWHSVSSSHGDVNFSF